MEFFSLIAHRRSIRQFADKAVEKVKLNRILDAAGLAPSAGDLKAFSIVVVEDGEARSRLGDAAYDQDFVAQASVVLAFLADEKRSESTYGHRGATLYCIQDATIAAAYAQLAATDQGLATCWVGAFQEESVAMVIGAPPRMRPIALLPIGYPASALDA